MYVFVCICMYIVYVYIHIQMFLHPGQLCHDYPWVHRFMNNMVSTLGSVPDLMGPLPLGSWLMWCVAWDRF